MRVEKEIALLSALTEMYPNSKKNTLRKMLTEGRVSIDGKIIHKAKFLVQPGSEKIVSD